MAGQTERFYMASPIWMQQAAVGIYGWWWYQRRFGRRFRRLVADLKARERWTAEQFRAFQEEALRKLFAAAWNSPHYRQVFSEAGISPAEEPFSALRRMPILSKETLRTTAQSLLTRNRQPRGTIVFRSSGTTGTPTEIYYTRDFHALEMAVPEARNLHWAGVSHHDRRVMFGVRKVCPFDQREPPFWRFSPAENMAYASIYHLSPVFLPAYVEFLRSYRPAVIMGYPSALDVVASHALRLKSARLPAARAVFTTSEMVSADARERIESAFQCRVYDRYCAVEMCLFASECEYGRYHVSPDVGIVEILDGQGKDAPLGEMGEVVCTGLQNTLQPLIRYHIGDVARWAVDQHCTCGRAMPILESIDGRCEDMCCTADGRQMLRFDTVFKGIQSIRAAQVVQETLSQFTIYVVPANGFGATEVATIEHNMAMHAGNVRVVVKPVETIQRSASGKFRAVVCKLSPEDKRRSRMTGPAERECLI
jgi:phenylacetate-CoA ligase